MILTYNGYTFPVFQNLNREQLSEFKQAIGSLRQDELDKKGECKICVQGDTEYWGRKINGNYSVASRVIIQRHEEIM